MVLNAVQILENIMSNHNRSEDDRVYLAKPILIWLSKLSMQGDSNAKSVLDDFRVKYADFLERNDIRV